MKTTIKTLVLALVGVAFAAVTPCAVAQTPTPVPLFAVPTPAPTPTTEQAFSRTLNQLAGNNARIKQALVTNVLAQRELVFANPYGLSKEQVEAAIDAKLGAGAAAQMRAIDEQLTSLVNAVDPSHPLPTPPQ